MILKLLGLNPNPSISLATDSELIPYPHSRTKVLLLLFATARARFLASVLTKSSFDIFHSFLDEPVCIMVKNYNSYIIDKLWIGSDVKNNPQNTDGRMQLQKFLFDHGLDKPSLEQFLKGVFPARPFIPLEGQMYKGKIKGLKSDDEGNAITAVIEANVGELLFMEAPRERIFAYGHYMGKADLRYLLVEGKN